MEAYRVLLRGVNARALRALAQSRSHIFTGRIRAANSAPKRCGSDLIRVLNRRSTADALIAKVVMDRELFASVSERLDSVKRAPPNCWSLPLRQTFVAQTRNPSAPPRAELSVSPCMAVDAARCAVGGNGGKSTRRRMIDPLRVPAARGAPFFSDRHAGTRERLGGRRRLKVFEHLRVTRARPRPPLSSAGLPRLPAPRTG